MCAFTHVLDLLERRVEQSPQAIAAVDGRSTLTYEGIATQSRRIASGIIGRDASARAVVVVMEKSCDALCALLGALYAGVPYVPVDPHVPLARLEHILQMLDDPCVIVDHTTKGIIERHAQVLSIDDLRDCPIDGEALSRRRAGVLETDPAYILFTSGSTGVPKGVAISHRAILSFIDTFVQVTGIREDDRLGSQAPFDFDVSTKDIYGAFASGATIVIIPRELFMQPAALMDYLYEQKVTVLIWAVAALCLVSSYHALDREDLPALRIVGFSGEVMPQVHLRKWRARLPHAAFFNLYGPTEVTCNCLYHQLDPQRDYAQGIPLGIPFPHCAVSVIDERGQEVTQPCEEGEIVVRGPSLALGYVGLADETRRAFGQDPLNACFPARVYHTGDLAAYDENGELFFRGRKDNQIKHLGHRIELEEIDVAIERVAGVDRCRCAYDQRRRRLYAFYEGLASEQDVYAAVAASLPNHMRPSTIRRIEHMPLSKNGKVDRSRLLGSESHGSVA